MERSGTVGGGGHGLRHFDSGSTRLETFSARDPMSGLRGDDRAGWRW